MLNRLVHRALRVVGWDFRREIPPVPKFIALGAPHTSNWDFVIFLGALHHFGVRARFLAKEGLFRWPFGYLFRALGGIPVGGSRSTNVVRRAIAEFETRDDLVLVIAPEGTRAAAPHWRTGFGAIAETTGVPVVLAGLDYPTRTVTIGPAITYHGDIEGFMERARAFYTDKRGLHPDKQGPVAVP